MTNPSLPYERDLCAERGLWGLHVPRGGESDSWLVPHYTLCDLTVLTWTPEEMAALLDGFI